MINNVAVRHDMAVGVSSVSASLFYVSYTDMWRTRLVVVLCPDVT